MADSGRLKFNNAANTKKQALPSANPMHIYLPLAPSLRPATPGPTLTEFTSLSNLRLFCFANLLGRVLRLEKRGYEFTQTNQGAELIIQGDPLMTLEPALSAGDNRLTLKVEGVLFKSEDQEEGLEVIRGYTLDEIQYLSYGTHYRSPLLVSEAALANARAALNRLHDYVERFAAEAEREPAQAPSKKADVDSWRDQFYNQIYDDLNLPRAMAVAWTMLQASLKASEKLALLAEFDRVLGLGITVSAPVVAASPVSYNGNGFTDKKVAAPVIQAKEKEQGKDKPRPDAAKLKEKERTKAPTGKPPKDKLVTGREGQSQNLPKGKPQPNQKSGKMGGPKGKEVGSEERPERRKIQSSLQVRSMLAETDRFDFTVSLVAHNNLAELRATVESVVFYLTRGARRVEVIAVDLGSTDGSAEYLDGVAASYANFRVLLAATNLGEAAGRNLAFRQGRGRFLLLLDAGLTLSGDIFEPLLNIVSKNERPALYGLYPLRLLRGTDNTVIGFEPQPLKDKEKDAERLPAEALEGALLCVRRADIEEAGFMDEHFHLPYALDLDYSFAFRDKEFEVIALPSLARFVNRPAGFSRPTYGLSPENLERQRQKNWNLFKKSWGV